MKESDLPKDVLRDILARAEPSTRQPLGAKLTKKAKRATETLVQPHVLVALGQFIAILPIVTRSEANEPAWQRKMARKMTAKRIFREAIGPHYSLLEPFARAYHSQKALRVRFTRLGGRKLDLCNLPTSMKAVEDMLAGALLADDGDPRWMVSYEQSLGGPVGVRIEMEVAS